MEVHVRILWIRRLTIVLVALAFAIMVAGSWVKATGSGLACPDWPACYGQWLPPFPSAENGGTDPDGPDLADQYTQAQVVYEWTHRALVSVFAIPFVALVALTLRDGGVLHPWLRRLPALAGIVLVAQIGLGRGTVVHGNPAALTTAHLAAATVILFLLTAAMSWALLRPLAADAAPVAPRPERRLDTVFPGEEA